MKIFKNIRITKSGVIVTALSIAPQLSYAVNKADSGLNSIQVWLGTIIPIVAGMLFLLAAVGHMAGVISRQFTLKLIEGCIIGGSGSWVVSLFF
ncbi:hypothetical protein HLB25_20850 [Dickeya dadantii]|uniref:hypothetical protein n=1 Tax=Dickeya dadantii TaxID=204038 RepID=UPI001495F353|nr:hypothetical protein [Dickeya dadantii]NPE57397.1 hypothetical protein [Dickeya dadantii]NPE68972.1 hypothetical protein [Dickeya dadantii]